MAWPKLLVLIRHAESEGNPRSPDERAVYECSTHEYPLTPRGRQQAEITGAYIREKFIAPFDVRYASYYTRAKETAQIVFPEQRIYEDFRLAEAQRGIYHTMTRQEIEKRFPEELKRKEREGLYHYRPIGGENWSDIKLRIHSFLETLNRDYDGDKVALIVHGHWLVLLQMLIEHFSVEEATRRYHEAIVGNASVTVYRGVEIAGKSRLCLDEFNIVPWLGKLDPQPIS